MLYQLALCLVLTLAPLTPWVVWDNILMLDIRSADNILYGSQLIHLEFGFIEQRNETMALSMAVTLAF